MFINAEYNGIELKPDVRHERSFITYKSIMRDRRHSTPKERIVVPKWEKKRLIEKKRRNQPKRETEMDLLDDLSSM